MKYRTLMAMLPLAALTVGCQPNTQCCDVVCETYVHRYGCEVPAHEWSQQGETGQVVTTMKDGVTCTKNYEQGYLEGETNYTFPHRDAVERIEHYQQNELVKEQYHYPSGLLREEVEHVSPTNHIARSYYDQGTIRSVETYDIGKLVQAKYYNLNQNVESGIEDGSGKRTNRDDFGQLESVDTFHNGVIALRTTYHANGTPREQMNYRDGVVQGTVRTFMPGGDPGTIEQWNQGVQEGVTEVYQHGEKVAEVPYVNGKKNGIEKRFSDGGDLLVEEVTWVDNVKHGPAHRYVNGKTVDEWYYQDKKVTHGQFERLSGPPMY